MKRILLVEDNADDEALTLRALKKVVLNHDIIIARDGVEAIEIVLGKGETADGQPWQKPQLILLDLKLPKVDGLEVLRRLRSHDETRPIPVVVFTSSSEERDILQSYCLGANSYIRKPVEFSQFCDAVRQISEYWLTLSQLPEGCCNS